MADDNILLPIYALDPGLVNRAIEQQLGQRIFGALGSYDNELGQRLIEIAHGSEIFGPASILDPELARRQINAALFEGGGTYIASAVHFDTSTTLTNAGGIGADSPLASWACWVRLPDFTDGFSGFLFGVHTNFPGSDYNSAGDCFVQSSDADSSYIFGAVSDETPLNENDHWYWIVGSIDTNHPASEKIIQYFVGDTQYTLIPQDGFDGNAFANDFSGPGLLGGVGTAFDMSDAFVWRGVFIDWTQIANRRLLFSSDGKPVNPANAISTFGTPAVMFTGNASTWATNQGDGGAYVLTGTALTNADSSPSS